MTVWQIAAGEPSRDYSDLCIQHDVVCVGPGDRGDFRHDEDAKAAYDKSDYEKVRRFCFDPSPGDVVLLRVGHSVKAVGVIPEGHEHQYFWRDEFQDILGWDLQHTRRVIWDEKALALLPEAEGIFGNYKQQNTITRVFKSPAYRRRRELKHAVRIRPLQQLPDVGPSLSFDSFESELFNEGLSSPMALEVSQTLQRVKSLAEWYWTKNSGDNRPSEHELVAHAIVPLLLGLGWSQQFVAVEWKRIDVALFDRPPTEAGNCIGIFEAKKLGSSLKHAFVQAKSYVEKCDLGRCQVIVTTDGQGFFVYRKNKRKWPDSPTGYFNIGRLRTSYAIPAGVKAVRTLVGLLPNRISQ